MNNQLSRRRVLVIEDEMLVAALLQDKLWGRAGPPTMDKGDQLVGRGPPAYCARPAAATSEGIYTHDSR